MEKPQNGEFLQHRMQEMLVNKYLMKNHTGNSTIYAQRDLPRVGTSA